MSSASSRPRARTAGLPAAVLAGLGLAGLLAGALAPLAPLFDLAAIAAPLALLAALAGALGLALTARRRPAAIVAILATLATAALPRLPGVGEVTACPPADRLTVAQFNVSLGNPDPAAVAAWLAGSGADVLLLQEADIGPGSVPARLAAAYPWQQRCHASGRCSTLVMLRAPPLARQPLAHGDPQNRRALSAAAATTPAGDFIAVHLSRPWPLGRQQAETALLAAALPANRRHLVIGGDFNAPGGKASLAGFARAHDLADASPTFPPGLAIPSWPAALPLLRLDHLLVGPGWQRLSARPGPALGSDHLPQLVTLCRQP